ncbi:MAG: M3 family oligoendopeptidase, partial [Anaerolineae bacterium]|nr:M3 family oligoendopeptidase [Anaerolineae bacterium]
MLDTLPHDYEGFSALGWPQIEAFCNELQNHPLSADNVADWLKGWSKLAELVDETSTRNYVATTVDTTDEAAEKRYLDYLENVITPWRAAEQRLKEKLLATGLQPEGFAIPLRNLRAQAELFREANLPLFNEESKLATEYSKIIGAQTVEWDGEEKTLTQLRPFLESPDRAVRERAFRATSARRLQDRDALNALWVKFLEVRQKIAANADMPDLRAYQWKNYLRFDYTPEDN